MCVNTSKGAIIMLMHDGKLMFYYSVCWKYFYWATNCSMRQKLSLLVPQRDWSIAAGQIQTPNFTEKWTALKRNFRELLPHIHTSHDVFQQTYIYTLCQMLIQHNLLYLLCTRNIKEENVTDLICTLAVFISLYSSAHRRSRGAPDMLARPRATTDVIEETI